MGNCGQRHSTSLLLFDVGGIYMKRLAYADFIQASASDLFKFGFKLLLVNTYLMAAGSHARL